MRLTAVWFAISIFGAVILSPQTDAGELRVTGQGVVEAAPDMATITLGVEAEAKSAAVALRRTSDSTMGLLDELRRAGVADRDLQTRDLSLSPLWSNRSSSSNSPPRIVGYRASNTVVARVRELDKLGEMLDAAVQSGANTFHGLTFGVQNPGPLQDAARQAAVEEAMRKANLYADAAGIALGDLLELSEAGAATPEPMAMQRMAMMSEAVLIAAGEIGIQAQVTLVFEID